MSEMAGSVQAGARASFGRRLGAWLIDVILIDIVSAIILLAGGRGVAYVVGIVLWLAYFTYFEGSDTGQTLGKRALGIRVYDFAGGAGAIGYGRGFVRAIMKYISGIPCALGYLWMLWDKEKQTWHDKVATTVVVPVSDYPV
ncbi:MAG TPA: RDD family protein [Gaiellaceae bacterium]